MKKVLVILMVLLAVTTTAVFAKQGFTLRGGFSYDFVNVKIPKIIGLFGDDTYWRANALGAEFGVTYNFSDSFLVYADTTLGFYGKFKVGDEEIKKDDDEKVFFLGTAEHAGVAYDFDFGSALDLQVGGGFAAEYARATQATTTTAGTVTTTETNSIGVLALGVGLYANVGYKLSDRVAITATVHPDFMFVSSFVGADTTSISDSESKVVSEVTHTTLILDTAFSFKFNASVGVTFQF